MCWRRARHSEEVATTWLVPDRVEIVRPPSDAADRGDEVGYDVLYPVRPGEQEQWTGEITHIFLRGAPRALRQGGRVYLSVLVRTRTRSAHRLRPHLRHHRRAARAGPEPDRRPHSRPTPPDRRRRHGHPRRGHVAQPAGLKYVTPGCGAYVKVGRNLPLVSGGRRCSGVASGADGGVAGVRGARFDMPRSPTGL